MAQNLAYLPEVGGESGYYVGESNDITDIEKAKEEDDYKNLGVFYSWTNAKTSCPSGWHLPTNEEWQDLERFLGIPESQIEKNGSRGYGSGEAYYLKSTETKEAGDYSENGKWISGHGGDNRYGFNAIAASSLYRNNLQKVGIDASFWTSTHDEDEYVYIREFYYNNIEIDEQDTTKYYHTVRCLQD